MYMLKRLFDQQTKGQLANRITNFDKSTVKLNNEKFNKLLMK